MSNNDIRFVKVTVSMEMTIPAATDDEKLTAVLPETVFEALWMLIGRPEDVTVLKVEESAGVQLEVAHG